MEVRRSRPTLQTLAKPHDWPPSEKRLLSSCSMT